MNPQEIRILPPGTPFMMGVDTPAISIGPGGFRTAEPVPVMIGDQRVSTTFELKGHLTDSSFVIAWWYKAEWHLIELDEAMKEWNFEWTLGWSPMAYYAVENRQRHVLASLPVTP